MVQSNYVPNLNLSRDGSLVSKLKEVGMPKYHFNIYDGETVRDPKGMELPDRSAAWKEATLATGELLNGFEDSLRRGTEFRMEVTDEFETPLWEIQVRARRK